VESLRIAGIGVGVDVDGEQKKDRHTTNRVRRKDVGWDQSPTVGEKGMQSNNHGQVLGRKWLVVE